MIKMELSLRRLTLTIVATLLIVTTGCTAPVLDGASESTTAKKNTEADEAVTPKDGRDLRTISIDEQFGYVEEHGELDGDDPRQDNKIYEPVEFAGKEGRYYNITMESNWDGEEMRLSDPNGNVVAVETGDSDTPAKFEEIRMNKTGEYTIQATSVEERATFRYTLSINEIIFEGPRDEWSEYERYSQFGSLSEYYWEEQSYHSNATFKSVNTSEDFAVVRYERYENANYSVQNTNYAFMARTLIEVRNYIANDPEGLQRENPEEWYPKRVYFTGYNESGDLVQTNYVSQRWTAEYMAGGNEETQKYFYRIVGTTKYGPAHNDYSTADGNETVRDETFPYPTYNESYDDFPTE